MKKILGRMFKALVACIAFKNVECFIVSGTVYITRRPTESLIHGSTKCEPGLCGLRPECPRQRVFGILGGGALCNRHDIFRISD